MKEEVLSMNAYESVFLLPADCTPQRVDEFIEKLKSVITAAGGEITMIDKWGRRRLAYPVKRHREGFYTFLMFNAPGAVLAEITRLFQVNEDVFRHIVCKALVGKPGSPTMSIPAPLMQVATTPYFRPNPMAPGAPAPAGAPVAPKEDVSESPAPAAAE
jgi:small subunit ribosomal protein S6